MKLNSVATRFILIGGLLLLVACATNTEKSQLSLEASGTGIVTTDGRTLKISDFLGSQVSELLESKRFDQWPVERLTVDDLEEPRIYYTFRGHALELICDGKERINTIFLKADDHNASDGELFEVPFDWTRERVINYLGTPEKGGPARTIPILGYYGPWDRFRFSTYTIHVQYKPDRDSIQQITLMQNDVVP